MDDDKSSSMPVITLPSSIRIHTLLTRPVRDRVPAAPRTQEADLQDALVFALASLAETRNGETGSHIQRTQQYVEELAGELKKSDPFKSELTSEAIKCIVRSAPLHDIGKVGIPDYILLKPGKLTCEEFELMKMHTVIGRNAIIRAEACLKQPNHFLRFAKEIVYSHHERWDGNGYPEGLAGQTIPLSARLMTVADVYDALISRRVYKSAYPHSVALEIIKDGAGSHFDPAIVKAFLTLENRFKQIAASF